jgi:hypothetical protein
MKLLVRLALLAGLIVAGFWAWSVLFPGPEKIIQRRLVKAARLVSFTPNEGNIARIANLQQLGTLLADNIEVSVDAPGLEHHTFNQRSELTQAVLGVHSVIRGLQVKLPDIAVQLAPDKQSAIANATVEAVVTGDKDLNISELKFTLKKIDGAWLITGVESVKMLQ